MHTDSKNISVFFMYKHIHTHTATERQRDQFKDKMTKSSFELIVKDEGSNFFKKQKWMKREEGRMKKLKSIHKNKKEEENSDRHAQAPWH